MRAKALASRGQKQVSYKEDSSSSSDTTDHETQPRSDGTFDEAFEPRWSGRTRRRSSSPQRLTSNTKRKTPRSRLNGRSTPAKRMRSQGASRKVEQTNVVIKSECKVPAWQTLPYHIWADIFFHASEPLWICEYKYESRTSIAWLLKCACLCRAFAEPALSALYYAPPLASTARIRDLTKSLASQHKGSFTNYRCKIKYLDIVAFRHKKTDRIDLGKLVSLTPQLRGLKIVSPTDMYGVRYQYFRENTRICYQRSIFTALDTHRITLRSWSWDTDPMPRVSRLNLVELHASLPFRALRSLSIVEFNEKDWTEDELANAISSLPHLKHLSFMASNIVNQQLLPLLPRQLEQLKIMRCSTISSDIIAPFLVTHGQDLQELILENNRRLNLSFLPGIAISCPRLKVLRISLQSFCTNPNHPNTNPQFAKLLLEDETPSWPRTLQNLELLHLRRWNLTTAERFFSSLAESSASLRDLRHLRIKASLEESGWRDRVGFRDKWSSILEAVFLRPSTSPNSHFTSISAFHAWKSRTMVSKGNLNEEHLNISPLPVRHSRRTENMAKNDRFSHVEVKGNAPRSITDSDSPGYASLATVRRSTRLKQQGRASPQAQSDAGVSQCSQLDKEHHETENVWPFIKARGLPVRLPSHRRIRPRKRESDYSSSSEDSAIDDDAGGKPGSKAQDVGKRGFHIQGLCNVVHVVIDNLRPTNEQLDEDDFLDDEVSGDEDWNGDDDSISGLAYAW